MATETLHMKVGEQIGEVLLDIAQTNILHGDPDKGIAAYTQSFQGFTKEHALACLKNEMVLEVDEDGEGVHLSTEPETIKGNAHNIIDWQSVINSHLESLNGLLKNLKKTKDTFEKYYSGDILNYDMIELMKRYYDDEELKTMSGITNIAARICGHPECKISDKGWSNPWMIWANKEGRVENYILDPDGYEYDMPAKWEIILVMTVKYNKLIRALHKEYLAFEKTYLFLLENGFINKPSKIEETITYVVRALKQFSDIKKGYYHPLCNTGLREYKEMLLNDLLGTKYGNEYCQNGIIQKDIMDGYDAGWLSPDGEYYGADGETSEMIHMVIAEQIFHGNNRYAKEMAKDAVNIYSSNSPEQWLSKHGWVKIHHDDCYGSFIGRRDEEPTPDFPYAYNPTEIQIKMICDYADKFYGGKFYTEANAMGRIKNTEPFSTYKVRQMDDIMIHKIFGI